MSEYTFNIVYLSISYRGVQKITWFSKLKLPLHAILYKFGAVCLTIDTYIAYLVEVPKVSECVNHSCIERMADIASTSTTQSAAQNLNNEQELNEFREIVWGSNIRLDVFQRWSQGLYAKIQCTSSLCCG